MAGSQVPIVVLHNAQEATFGNFWDNQEVPNGRLAQHGNSLTGCDLPPEISLTLM